VTSEHSPGGTLPADTTIRRVALRVTDLDRMVAFYRDVIGLSVLSRTDEGATLGPPQRQLLELIADPDAADRGRSETGLFHTAFLVPTRQALADALVRIERHTQLTGASDHLVSEALSLSDPEGNGIEVYCDRPRSEWPGAEGGIEMGSLPLDLADLRQQAGLSGGTTDGVPEETTVGHVHLEVSSIEQARAFYADVLGFEQSVRPGESALFVAAGGYHHHVGLNVWNGRTATPPGRGLAWFEIGLPDDGPLAAVRERLATRGFDPHWKDGSLTVADSDGITVRFSQS
jgi:catechol 2,3-dioxygenase